MKCNNEAKVSLVCHSPTATSLQRTNNLNPRTIWYLALDESNRIKSAYFIIHPPPQNGCRLKAVINTGFTSSTSAIQRDFSQNQPGAITLNTGSPRTLSQSRVSSGPYKLMMRNKNKNWEAGSLTLKVPAIEAPLWAKSGGATWKTELRDIHCLLPNPPLAHMFGTSPIRTPVSIMYKYEGNNPILLDSLALRKDVAKGGETSLGSISRQKQSIF